MVTQASECEPFIYLFVCQANQECDIPLNLMSVKAALCNLNIKVLPIA